MSFSREDHLLHLKGLPATTTIDDLRYFFSYYGKINKLYISRNAAGRCSGFGIIAFEEEASVLLLSAKGNLTFMNKKIFMETYIQTPTKKNLNDVGQLQSEALNSWENDGGLIRKRKIIEDKAFVEVPAKKAEKENEFTNIELEKAIQEALETKEADILDREMVEAMKTHYSTDGHIHFMTQPFYVDASLEESGSFVIDSCDASLSRRTDNQFSDAAVSQVYIGNEDLESTSDLAPEPDAPLHTTTDIVILMEMLQRENYHHLQFMENIFTELVQILESSTNITMIRKAAKITAKFLSDEQNPPKSSEIQLNLPAIMKVFFKQDDNEVLADLCYGFAYIGNHLISYLPLEKQNFFFEKIKDLILHWNEDCCLSALICLKNFIKIPDLVEMMIKCDVKECLTAIVISDNVQLSQLACKVMVELTDNKINMLNKEIVFLKAAVHLLLPNSSMDKQLVKSCVVEIVNGLKDPDLDAKRRALFSLKCAVQSHPTVMKEFLDSLLPHLYLETKIRMAFECLFNLMDSCSDDLDCLELLTCVQDGMKDHFEIKKMTYLILERLAILCPSAILKKIEQLVEALRMTCSTKVKVNAVKQEFEKEDELKRSAMQAFNALLTVPDADKNPFVKEFLTQIRSTRDLQSLFESIQKDSSGSE